VDTGWEREASEGAEVGGINERGSVGLGVSGDVVALVEPSSWLRAGSARG
jgi:hypothetical protein